MNLNSKLRAWLFDNMTFIDTETTGLKPGYHEVIELYADNTSTADVVHVRKSVMYEERAQPQALAVNGYDKATWGGDGAWIIQELTETTKRITANCAVVAGWYVKYDIDMINGMDTVLGYPTVITKHIVPTFSFDVKDLAMHQLKRLGMPLKSYKQTSVAQALMMPFDNAHTAKGDVQMTMRLYLYFKLLSKLPLPLAKIALRCIIAYNTFVANRAVEKNGTQR